eukprot:scaffold27766_cov60-Phaeocystis_antarctica.AAC.1
MPPFGVLERCVGRLRSPPSLAARAALQWRPPPDGGARRRAESKAIAVEFGASCTCCARPVSAPMSSAFAPLLDPPLVVQQPRDCTIRAFC